MPEFEPRGCPRGASFSWYEYSPLRVKYPYIRGKLLDLWNTALEENNGNRIARGHLLLKTKRKQKHINKHVVKVDMFELTGKM